MKTLIALLLVSTAAHASVTGFLINQRMVITVTGMSAWQCTYKVMGQQITYVMPDSCPSSMEFN